MDKYPEIRAILLRRGSRVSGFVGKSEFAQIVDFFGDWLSIQHCKFTPAGRYERRRDGGAQLILPWTSLDHIEVHSGCHELGHALLDLPPADRDASTHFAPDSLADHLESRDEAECHAFVDALRLPRYLVRAYLGNSDPDWAGLIADSGCTRAEIQRRFDWMQQYEAPQILTAPAWSAWGHYRMYEQAGQMSKALVIAPRAGGPEITLPYRSPREYRALYWQVRSSLAALRPHEFALKYSADHLSRTEMYLHWDEWREEAEPIEERC